MKNYKWGIIGAGPAGIAAVGKLLDFGVSDKDIIWIDPEFQAGDLAGLWGNVPSNTKVKLFTKFLNSCDSFNFKDSNKTFPLQEKNPEDSCYLKYMAEPLYWVTSNLRKRVSSINDTAVSLDHQNNEWHVTLKNGEFKAQKIILAQGATPKGYSVNNKVQISLQDAIDFKLIQGKVNQDDTVAVFGSSHSAVLILRNLVNQKVKKIINFYRSPLLYAIYYDDWILYDDSGLKGEAAVWAKQYLEKDIPANLLRVCSNEENINKYMQECNKVVAAVGFKRRDLPKISGLDNNYAVDKIGKIAENLYGIGVAHPEAKYNTLGMLEYRVGLWKFMDYLNRVMPDWL